MLKLFKIIMIIACLTAYTKGGPGKGLACYVDPFIGTGSTDSLSLSGSNFPGPVWPFGLVQLSPDTDDNPEDPCCGYDYSDSTIVGFSHTHLSGTGVADLFDFLFMPYQGKTLWEAGSDDRTVKGYRSSFSHDNEVAYPGYYRVKLNDHDITVELTSTEHCGMQRYTFSDDSSYKVIINLDHSLDKARPYWKCRVIGAQARIINDSVIEGYRLITGWARLRKVYFRSEFSRPFSSWEADNGRRVLKNPAVVNSTSIKVNLSFSQNNDQPLIIKTGLSSVSYEGARENLKGQIEDFDFDKIQKENQAAWEKELERIVIQGSEKTKKIFYTGLYHAFIHPSNIADMDGAYLNSNFEKRYSDNGKHYSVFSLWDTFRAAHPLYSLVQPERTADFINSMLRQYEDYGYLPIWQLWGSETYCMIGNHAIPVILDAFIKDIPEVDYQLAYEAVKASLTEEHPHSPFSVLNHYGYYPEPLLTQSVSITLESAFNDWCAAMMAKKIGEKEDYLFFLQRSRSYAALFHKETGFFRAKDEKGQWITPFNPLKYGGNGGYPFTEGNAWQYLWSVFHERPRFIALMGGPAEFSAKLDTFFTLEAKPEDVNGNASGFIGQYAHGNEPSHHIAYLYNDVGRPRKTQHYVSKILKEQYTDQPSGYTGNEDCGQMSAWYIFSSLGFYPVNPASGIYSIGSPAVEEGVLKLRDGKTFTIKTHNLSEENIHIKKILLNGKPYAKFEISQEDILKGGILEFFMEN